MTEPTTTEIVEPKSDTETDRDTETGDDLDAVRAELDKTRKALKAANREAAERRKAIEAFEQQEQERREAELSELEKVKAKLEKADQARQEAEARLALKTKHDAFFAATDAAQFTWASEMARQDAVALINWADVDDESLGELPKVLKKQRPYLFQQPSLPDIDGQRRGGARKPDEDEERVRTVARRWSIPYSEKE